MSNEDNNMINNALQIIKQNNQWIEYIKNFNSSDSFMFTDTPILNTISQHICNVNPEHSGASLGMCLQHCKKILNNNNNND